MYDFHFTMNFHNEYLCSKFLIIHVIFSKALSTKCVLKCQTASLIIFVCGKMSFSIRLLVTLVATSVVTANYDPNCFGTRQAIVHLFEWRWDDIADECENFLAPKGYCGVQVSPPNEYRVVTSPMRPWWERYQPVSYKTYSRSGDEDAFKDMVTRCNNVGVRIYVDALLNHMAGVDASRDVGIAGTPFNAETLDFPGVPYSANDFNQQGKECHTSSGNIENYGDADQVRNCRLVGLTDLKQSSTYVRQKLVEWLDTLTSYGVAGFRLDAAKHMWPNDIKAIINALKDLPTKWFPSGSKPFIFQEVIDYGGEPIKNSEYYTFSRVTEFSYGRYTSEAMQGQNQLKNFKNFGEGWGYLMPDYAALVFIDNHDNQRGHGGGGSVLTHTSPKEYKKAVAYMLAWPYGVPRVMSSYYFSEDWTGPPHDDNYNIKRVLPNGESCENGWVCEHRWRPIANMAKWRAMAGSEPVANWWDDGDNQIAFSRGNKAFFAINNGWNYMKVSLQTGMKAGRYCDVISGDRSEDEKSCTGNVITVGSDGKAMIEINNGNDNPYVAIHVGKYYWFH